MLDMYHLMAALWIGLQITLKVTVGAVALGVVLSLIAGVLLVIKPRWPRAVARIYVEIFRGTSAIVQLFWFYFVLPLVGIEMAAIDCSILVLGLNMGAYGAEVFRGAINNIAAGQWQAATALNMSYFLTLRRIILPQAWLQAMPSLTNLMIELLKATALVSLITINDLTFQAQMLRAATLETTKIFAAVLITYYLLSQVITYSMGRIENILSRGRVRGRIA